MTRRHWNLLVVLVILSVCAIKRAAAEPAELWLQRWGFTSARAPIAYHRDTHRLFATHAGRVVLWDLGRGLALREFAPSGAATPDIRSLGLTTDGERLLLGASSSLQLVDSASGKAVASYDLHGDALRTAALSPAGHLVVAACSNGRIRIWKRDSGEALGVLDAKRELMTICVSPDNRTLLSGGDDGVAILWDLETGSARHHLQGPTEIRSAAFNANGTRVLTRGSGQYWYTPRVVAWDVASGLPVQVVPRTAIDAWFEGEQIALVLPDGSRELWPTTRREAAPAPKDAPTYPTTPQRRWLFTQDHWTLQLEDRPARAILHPPSAQENAVELTAAAAQRAPATQLPLDLSGDGRWLLTAADKRRDSSPAVVWDLHEARLLRALKAGDSGKFHPDARRVIVGQGQELTLFDLQSGDPLRTFRSDKGAFGSAQFTHRGTRLLTAVGDWYDGDRGALWLWDIETGERLRNYVQTDKAVISAQMVDDDQTIIAALTRGEDGSVGIDEISVIDAVSGTLRRSETFVGAEFSGNLLIPTANQIIGYRYRGKTSIYDAPQLTRKHHFPGVPTATNADGTVLAVSEATGLISYRDLHSGKRLATQRTSLQPSASLFHPGAAYLVGKTKTLLNDHPRVGPSIGFHNVLTGKLEAELFLFEDADDWLITTADSSLNGSPGGLQRVTWRHPGTSTVQRQPERTERIRRPAEVAKLLSHQLAPGSRLTESLAALPDVPLPEPSSEGERYLPWYQQYRLLREQATAALREAGADLKIDRHGQVSLIHLEKRAVSDELLQQLRWVATTQRLYLADTGITDRQLQWVGLMPNVRRLSLWGNSITDQGLAKLSGLWRLEVLDVHNTQVTAQGLSNLRLLENLKTLIVPDHIDPAALKPLESLRELEIVFRAAKSSE